MIEDSKIIRYLIIGVSFFVIVWLLTIRADIIEKGYQFNGIIEKITYNEKKIPEITVNGKAYGLSTSWRFNEKMSVGDSLIKEKGLLNYKLIKYKTGKVIFSK